MRKITLALALTGALITTTGCDPQRELMRWSAPPEIRVDKVREALDARDEAIRLNGMKRFCAGFPDDPAC